MKQIIIVFFVVCCVQTQAQVWQWSVPVRGAKEGDGKSTAFLWIPPDCRRIKGILVAQNNMEELSILESATIRRAMAKEGFAEIWVSPFFDHLFRFNEGAGEVFAGMLHDLAEASGYTALNYAPVVPIGHSAAASWPYYFAVWKPERTLCALSTSGQWPYFRSPVFAPDIWGSKELNYVPLLETMGEYEAANTWSTEGLKERTEHPLMPLSMLACPGEWHFSTTEKKNRYIALYIHKAIAHRVVKNCTDTSFAVLKPIDPTKEGWLVDKWRLNQTPAAAAAPVGKYTGDTAQAFWFFDKEMAEATVQYEAAYRNRKAPLIGYVQDGKTVPQQDTHQQVDLKFEPLEDGITFRLHTRFLDTVPKVHERMSLWTGLPAGSPVGHPKNNIPITVSRIIGPFEKLDDSTFRLQLQKDYNPDAKEMQCWFVATHPGDEKYKPASQQARMVVPIKNKKGKEQHIRFVNIPEHKSSAKPVVLQASSDAGLPVRFYVKNGPAELKGNVLTLTKIPPRSKYPVAVTVVAWQYGIAGKVQSAEAVEQTFYVNK